MQSRFVNLARSVSNMLTIVLVCSLAHSCRYRPSAAEEAQLMDESISTSCRENLSQRSLSGAVFMDQGLAPGVYVQFELKDASQFKLGNPVRGMVESVSAEAIAIAPESREGKNAGWRISAKTFTPNQIKDGSLIVDAETTWERVLPEHRRFTVSYCRFPGNVLTTISGSVWNAWANGWEVNTDSGQIIRLPFRNALWETFLPDPRG